jgi:dipeptidyl aminopeptidase/acylaminoacyl peptidase
VWVDREGKEEPLAAAPHDYGPLRISPDGTRVAFSFSIAGNEDIWIWDIDREIQTRLTFDEATDGVPLWTPDGKRIVLAQTARDLCPSFRKPQMVPGRLRRLAR